mgnify:CR=1 FL=1
MKAFEFKPKLYTALKNYSKELFMADLMAGIIVGIVALPLAIAFGIASGVSPEKGIITAIIAGFIISLQSSDRRPYRCIHRYHLRHYSAIWRGRTDCSHADGRRHSHSVRSVQAGSSH